MARPALRLSDRGTPVYEARAAVFAIGSARSNQMPSYGLASGGAEIPRRPALARYWRALQARPSFVAADIWTKLHVGGLIGGIVDFGRG